MDSIFGKAFFGKVLVNFQFLQVESGIFCYPPVKLDLQRWFLFHAEHTLSSVDLVNMVVLGLMTTVLALLMARIYSGV